MLMLNTCDMWGLENVFRGSLAMFIFIKITRHKNKFPEISQSEKCGEKGERKQSGYLILCSMLHKTLDENYAPSIVPRD